MKEKKTTQGWLFVCFIASEKKYVCHTVANPSFFKALQEHAAIFPTHHVVFTLQVPMFLAEYIGKELQYFFKDSDAVYAEFVKCINAPNVSFVITQVKTYQGLIPLTYSDVNKRFGLSAWNGEYYEAAQAFVLHASLIEFFNFLFFNNHSDNNPLNLFRS